MYRPNFCTDCGERIWRKRWYPWTTRRFCPKCATRLRRATVLVPLFSVVALTVAAWLIGHSASPEPPPLIIEQGAFRQANPADSTATGDAPSGDNAQTQLARATPPTARASYNDTIEDPTETVSICGARTKKGAPCSRRVRGTGRCFQHRGRAAMLAPGKLIVN
jgi:hypothetical protein